MDGMVWPWLVALVAADVVFHALSVAVLVGVARAVHSWRARGGR